MNAILSRKRLLILIFQATLIGIISGFVSVLFNMTMDFLVEIMDSFTSVTSIYLLIIPIIAGLLVGLIRQFLLSEKNQGFSVSQVMLDLEEIKVLIMNPKSVFIKIVGTFITLVSGFSAGRQGPIVHIGGAIGANISYYLKKDEIETRILIGCGVAGCLAGVFNAPLFATVFVIEILFNKKYLLYISVILLSSVSSVIFRTYAIQSQPFLTIKLDFAFSSADVTYFVLIGVLAGLVAVFYTYLLHKSQYLFGKINQIYLRTVLGGLIVGLTLYFAPQLYSIKYNSIDYMLKSNMSLYLLFGIFITKLFITSISLGSGGIGGSFNPGIYLGAILGFMYGKILILTNLGVSSPYTYAAVGMAAMFSGFAHAPLTATIMVVELTGHYELIFPVVIANLSSSVISEFIQRESIYNIELRDLILKFDKE